MQPTTSPVSIVLRNPNLRTLVDEYRDRRHPVPCDYSLDLDDGSDWDELTRQSLDMLGPGEPGLSVNITHNPLHEIALGCDVGEMWQAIYRNRDGQPLAFLECWPRAGILGSLGVSPDVRSLYRGLLVLGLLQHVERAGLTQLGPIVTAHEVRLLDHLRQRFLAGLD